MSIWYEIKPIDTLFFRGAEPLEAGQLTSNAIFPPPVSVIQGALRTNVLRQRKISFSDYNNGRAGMEVEALIGKSGEEAPFKVTAIFLKKNGKLYSPTPVTWYLDDYNSPISSADFTGKEIKVATLLSQDNLKKLKIVTSSNTLPFIKAEKDAISLADTWAYIDLFSKKNIKLANQDILYPEDLYIFESRTGISLLDKETGKPTHNVQEGALFSAKHIRLKEGVTIVVGITQDIGLEKEGFIKLGGEQRISFYSTISKPALPNVGERFVATSAVVANKEVLSKLISSRKPMVIAGWDLAKGFHKKTQTLLPAGSVFSENINGQCLPLAQ